MFYILREVWAGEDKRLVQGFRAWVQGLELGCLLKQGFRCRRTRPQNIRKFLKNDNPKLEIAKSLKSKAQEASNPKLTRQGFGSRC